MVTYLKYIHLFYKFLVKLSDLLEKINTSSILIGQSTLSNQGKTYIVLTRKINNFQVYLELYWCYILRLDVWCHNKM